MKKSVHLDSAMASIFTIISSIFWLINNIAIKKKLKSICFHLGLSYLIIIFFIEVASLHLFQEWGSTLNFRAINYLLNPKESIASSKPYLLAGVNFWFLLVFIGSIYSYQKIFKVFSQKQFHDNNWLPIISCFILLFIGSRGGIQKLPIKPSIAFHSNNSLDNFVCVNKTNYLIYDHLQHRSQNISPIPLLPNWNSLLKSSTAPDTLELFEIEDFENLKVVLIILEGWSTDLSSVYNNPDQTWTPNFDQLAKNGLVFSQLYSSGFRTDQGLLAMINGISAVPSLNLMNSSSLYESAPSLFKSFHTQKFHTAFYYGGDLLFSNLAQYLASQNIDLVIGKNDFNKKLHNTEWGVADKDLVSYFLKNGNELRGKSFCTLLFQSSHSPFDFPNYKSDLSIPELYKQSVKYSDEALGHLIKNYSEEENIIYFIVSDHGSLHLQNKHYNDHDRFKVPCLIYSPLLKDTFRGKKIKQIWNHHDLAPFILSQLKINNDSFRNSISRQGAFWTTDNTYGLVTESGKIVMDRLRDKIAILDESQDSSYHANLARAYLLESIHQLNPE